MRGLKQRGILLSVDTYRMENKETGEVTDGMKCWYIPDETLEDLEREARGELNVAKGIHPYQVTFPFEYKNKLGSVPGIYDFKMEYRDVKQKSEFNGQITSKTVQGVIPVDFEFAGNIKINIVKGG